MHEVTIAQAIVDIVRDHAARDGFTRVKTIRLAIGALSHVDPRALEFGFEVVARGTVADGARLAIDRPGGEAFCTDCEKTVPLAELGAACPTCGGYRCIPSGGSGEQMRVVEMEVL